MKAIIQRVMKASVTVGDEVVGSIGRGLCVLVGISRYDTPKEMEYIVRKVLNLRLFDDDGGKRWAKNVMDKQFEVLCVSQFTLCVTLKGNKPDFHEAMGPDLSQQMYQEFLKQLGAAYSPDKVQDGKFGAYMQVNIQNDGPVTIPLECVPAGPNDVKKADKRAGKQSSSKVKSDEAADSSPSESPSSPGASGLT
ncbi:D-aminoacyl-tRNA deacylase-like isoform X2 [Haliotis rufescens]|uniref:D-aminoacyl-tRNA deacylase-like isoform X2 n=1 Tax=Haliotis rufescens TaxID=6454 RepID=UPI001EAFEBB9|nr:D-aminoacyl-tRNA deacylase-like isoform X2 [Haliotis rufescens]